MRFFRIVAGVAIATLPIWIVFVMCAAYAGLSLWLTFWIGSYSPAIAILMVSPVAIIGLLFLAVCVGGEIVDNTRLREWCNQRAEKYLPSVEAATGGNQG
jgi:hypothetical protein